MHSQLSIQALVADINKPMVDVHKVANKIRYVRNHSAGTALPTRRIATLYAMELYPTINIRTCAGTMMAYVRHIDLA